MMREITKSTDALEFLRKWKTLPNYRAEPRVDYLISLAFPDLIYDIYKSNISVIIPELPIRIGNLGRDNDSDKSYKVDYYLLLEDGRNIFIELKTDLSSRRKKQDDYLKAAKSIKMSGILDGIVKIYNATTYKLKYKMLIDLLIENDLITTNFKTCNKCDDIDILYIQPNGDESNIFNFEKISKYFITSNDPFLEKFGRLLLEWSSNPVS